MLALTRRGHGESDHPGSGYDIDTLTQDIALFLDELGIRQVILAGHSFAGVEMSHFAAIHPERVAKVIYLDAAFYRNLPSFKEMRAKNPLQNIQVPWLDVDYYSVQQYFEAMKKAFPSLVPVWHGLEAQGLHEITIQPDGKVVDRMTPEIEKALNDTVTAYQPEDAQIRVPVLNFASFPDGEAFISREYMTETQQKEILEFFATTRMIWLRQTIQQFRHYVPQARIVEILHGHHYCFIQQKDLVYNEMIRFLLE